MPRYAPFAPALIDTEGNLLPNSVRRDFWDRDAYAYALKHGEAYTTIKVDNDVVRVASRRFPANGTPQGVIQAPYRATDIYKGMAKLRLFAFVFLIPIAIVGGGLNRGMAYEPHPFIRDGGMETVRALLVDDGFLLSRHSPFPKNDRGKASRHENY